MDTSPESQDSVLNTSTTLPQSPVPPTTSISSPTLVRQQPSAFIKFIRIFLLVLIIIGIALLCAQKYWVPSVVNFILSSEHQVPVVEVSTSTSTTATASERNVDGVENNVSQDLINGLMATTSYKYELVYTSGSGLAVNDANWVPDIHSFVRLDSWYYEDNNYVYSTNPQTGLVDRMTYADRATFTVLSPNATTTKWAKDKRYVYDYGQPVTEADPNTFEIINGSAYAKDATHVFYSSSSEYFGIYNIVKGADPTTFVSVPNRTDYDAQDKDHEYWSGMAICQDPTKKSCFLSDPKIYDNGDGRWYEKM